MKQTIAIPLTVSNSSGGQIMNRISLPAMPGDPPVLDRDPRHETAPRRDVQTPPQRVTVDEVVAIVRLRGGATVEPADLLDVAAQHIARYKLPKAIVRVPAVVRSPAGKADYGWAREVVASTS